MCRERGVDSQLICSSPFSGRCSSMWDAAGTCPCPGSATLSSPQEHSLGHTSSPLGAAHTHHTATLRHLTKGVCARANPFCQQRGRDSSLGHSSTGEHTCICSIFCVLSWTCRGPSAQGSTAPCEWNQLLHTEEFRALADVLSAHTLLYSLLIVYRSFESTFLFSSLSC